MPKNENLVRREWPKIRIIFKNGKKYYQVDARRTGTNLKQERAPSLEAAEKRAKEILGDFEKLGSSGVSIDPDLRTFAIKADEILKPFGKSVLQAAEFYRDFLEDQKKKAESRIIGELADEWLQSKESGNKKLRPSTLQNLKKGAKFLKDHWPHVNILTLTPNAIDEVIKAKKTARTRINTLSLVSQFFNWCKHPLRKYCQENPCEKIEKYEEGEREIEILSPEKAEAFMRLCEGKYPSLMVYHALQLFGGLRPDEARLMRWEDIHLGEKRLYVPKTITKVKDDRPVTISKTLELWIQSYKGERKGHVTPHRNFFNLIKQYRFELGYNLTLYRMKNKKYVKIKNPNADDYVADCCRHSFASYMLSIGHTRGELAEEMGNSVQIIKNHYKKVVSRKEGEKFFSIVPCEYAEIEKAEQIKLRNLIKRAK